MTTRMMTAGLALFATVAHAQGRGGRQGGPGGQGTMCLDVNNVAQIEMLQGTAAVAEYGPKATNGIMIIQPKAGVPLANILTPCAGGSASQQDDPFNANLFAPSWVMSHQQAVNLTDEQKNFIQSRLVSTQTRFAEMDLKLRSEMETLTNLLATRRVDQTKVLSSLDRVLDTEREIKRAQVSLMVDVKDKLTTQQQAQLEQLRTTGGRMQVLSKPACPSTTGPTYVIDGKPVCEKP
jgi:Spy/CpxP family protein refolding chaperone